MKTYFAQQRGATRPHILIDCKYGRRLGVEEVIEKKVA